MSAPKKIFVKESVAELRKLQKNAIPMIATRIRLIIELKKHEETGISKRNLANLVGVDQNSAQTWRSMYEKGGIESILHYEKHLGRASDISAEEHAEIEKKLKDPENGLRGYVELLDWMETTFKRSFKYNTVLKYSYRHFQSKVKVARKSHVKKNEEAVNIFKKTLVKNVKQ